MGGASTFVVGAEPDLARRVEALSGARMVFLAGLPGTGKSFLAHQVTHLASERGRTVHLVQWDVARPVFEASDAARRYPIRDGVTHAVVRKAVGLWARHAVATWNARHADGRHLLIGETPFVGNRLIELARPDDDAAEPLLRTAECRFAIPVPSAMVRAFLEAERERRAACPRHPREREDAPPVVLRALWHELVRAASALGIAGADALAQPAGATRAAGTGHARPASEQASVTQETDARDRVTASEPAWDAERYRGVYETVLRHRRVDVVRVDTVLPTSSMSVYEHAVAPRDVVPTTEEARSFIAAVEERYPSLAALEREIERWYVV